jgi:peroxiredoxin
MYEDSDWLKVLRWSGVVLAIILGTAYYIFAYTPNTSSRSVEKTASASSSATSTQGVTSIIPRSTLVLGVGIGMPAPDFSLPVLDKPETIRLSQFKGKPLLLYFWASWCLPCRLESPYFEKTYRAKKESGFTILAVNTTSQDSLQDVRAFVKEFDLTFPILLDQTDSVSQFYQVRGLPTSFFIKPNGLIQRIFIGGMSDEQIEEFTAEILTP